MSMDRFTDVLLSPDHADLDAAPAPLHVLVVGAGVAGLTSAVTLALAGHRVTVLARDYAPEVTSVVAGALWEWPPAVCGHHRDEASIERSKEWCVLSYELFGQLARDPATGVHVRPVVFHFRRPVTADPAAHRKMTEVAEHVDGFRHDGALIDEHGVSPDLGLRDAYTYLTPMIDTDVLMRWLAERARALDVELLRGEVHGDLLLQESRLRADHDADVIVNCTGLGAAELAGDEVYPLRGALVRARNDGRRVPQVTAAHAMTYTGNGGQDMVFIVPRGEDTLLLGGLVEPWQFDTGIGLHNHAPVREMLERCFSFLPALRDIEIDQTEPVRAGLRPYRPSGPRVEAEPAHPVVHNYGHGGSGVTWSWGCAREVTRAVGTVARREHRPVVSV
ncbi:MAG: FAD-dependent oxidoreductase [Dermatophilaceae bacterium]